MHLISFIRTRVCDRRLPDGPGLGLLTLLMAVAICLGLVALTAANSNVFRSIHQVADQSRSIILPSIDQQQELAMAVIRLQQNLYLMRNAENAAERNILLNNAYLRLKDISNISGNNGIIPVNTLKDILPSYSNQLEQAAGMSQQAYYLSKTADDLLAAPPSVWRAGGYNKLVEMHRLMLIAVRETDHDRIDELSHIAAVHAQALSDPALFADPSFPIESRQATLLPLQAAIRIRHQFLDKLEEIAATQHRLAEAMTQLGATRHDLAVSDAIAALTQIAEAAAWGEWVMIGAILGLVMVLVLCSLWLRRILLHPLRAIATRAERVVAGGNPPRTHPWLHELQALARGVERLEDSLTVLRKTASEIIASELTLRQTNRELDTARVEALAANRAKSEFLALMSHELRTPLNAILGFSEMISKEMLGPVGEVRYLSYAHDIQRSGEHLLSVINDLLDLSKIEAGRWELSPELLDPDAVIAASLQLVTSLARRRRVKLNVQIDHPLPHWVADQRSTRQMLINLLSNACKFTPEGGLVQIRVSEEGDGGVRVSIADTGIGMNAAGIRRALEPYGQIESAVGPRETGTGLGLPLVKAMIELHGGRIAIESTLGVGTEVTLTFPPAHTATPCTETEDAGSVAG